jgi:hypothetical protein
VVLRQEAFAKAEHHAAFTLRRRVVKEWRCQAVAEKETAKWSLKR